MPGVASVGSLVESGGRGGDFYGSSRIFFKGRMELFYLGNGGFFGFGGNRDTSDEGEGWETLFFAFFEEIGVKTVVIRGEREVNNFVFWLESLDDNRGGTEVTATDATDNLS